MFDYAIYRFDYKNVREVYPRLELKAGYIPTYIYLGFWEGLYAGYMAGSFEDIDTIDIQFSQLVPEFRGVKTVRMIREMIKAIHRDFKNITTRADTKKNDMIKILLSAGFHIVGTKAYNETSVVELLKINKGG